RMDKRHPRGHPAGIQNRSDFGLPCRRLESDSAFWGLLPYRFKLEYVQACRAGRLHGWDAEGWTESPASITRHVSSWLTTRNWLEREPDARAATSRLRSHASQAATALPQPRPLSAARAPKH